MFVDWNTLATERSVRVDALHPALDEPIHLPRPSGYARYKNIAETSLALLLLLPTAPVIFAAALLVKLTSRGPVFYLQKRVGLGGRIYTMYKIRTMFHDCERLTGPRWATAQDPRITPVGRWLRRFHADELPQLWNVLRGEMSLVGPRPERPEIAQHLDRLVPGYRQRLVLRPGMTGLAQVQLPPDSNLASVRTKLAHDLYYIRRLGFSLDLRILACTACCLLGIPFRISNHLLKLPGGPLVEQAYQGAIANGTANGKRKR
jgi:lipopolysaccharide/colanic/teichoic acid biosynthesis glycosyltransferase